MMVPEVLSSAVRASNRSLCVIIVSTPSEHSEGNRTTRCEARLPSSPICYPGQKLVRPGKAEYMFAYVGENEIGRDRCHLIQPGLPEFALDIIVNGEPVASI